MKIFVAISLFIFFDIFPCLGVGIPFDSNHCKRKCESLFSDSPTKKSLCLGTCSNGFFEREKIIYKNNNNNGDSMSKCLANCSKNVNSATDFKVWTKCRKSCLSLSSQNKENNRNNYIFFEPDECNAECDRYWKGTVHWEPCQNQCQTFAVKYSAPNMENNKGNENDIPPPNPQKAIIYDIW